MQTIDLTKDQVQTVDLASVSPKSRKMSVSEARQKLDDVVAHLSQADCILQKEVKSHLDQAISIMLDIDEGQGWGNLGYRSVRHMIQTELEPRFSLSGSQFYRRFSAAKVRKEVSQIGSNVNALPDSHLHEIRKLPECEWTDAVEEITSKAPDEKLTAKHVKEIVTRRLQRQESADKQQSLRSTNTVENLHDDDSSNSENYQPPGTVMEPERHKHKEDTDSHPRALSSSAIEVTNIVTIQCARNATPEQQQYSGCWGIVHQLYEQSAFIGVGGEVVEYLFTDINLVHNPSPNLIQVCDRIKNLWQVPNLPASVQHLLATFYQQRLDFSQSDLNVLAAIESCINHNSVF